ncbi:Hypothetical predicted protein, partial [Mytilus galloprovincialis]
MPNKRKMPRTRQYKGHGKKRQERLNQDSSGQIIAERGNNPKKTELAGSKNCKDKHEGVGHVAEATGGNLHDFHQVWKMWLVVTVWVYRWVTLGPPPPQFIEGRPTPANRWGANWSIGNTSVFPGHSP